MTIRDHLKDSQAILDGRIRSSDELTVFRSRIQEMAQTGDLAMIGRIIDNLAKGYGDALLSEIPDREIGLSRGALVALRNLWGVILQYGEEDNSEPVETTEPNIYATLTELDA